MKDQTPTDSGSIFACPAISDYLLLIMIHRAQLAVALLYKVVFMN